MFYTKLAVCLLQALGICEEDKSVFPAITLPSSKARVGYNLAFQFQPETLNDPNLQKGNEL